MSSFLFLFLFFVTEANLNNILHQIFLFYKNTFLKQNFFHLYLLTFVKIIYF